MSFVYEASYIDLVCDSNEKAIDTHKQIPQKIELETKNIDCLANGTCALRKIQISNCQPRSKRNAEQKTAGFEIEITCDSHVCKYKSSYLQTISSVTFLMLFLYIKEQGLYI